MRVLSFIPAFIAVAASFVSAAPAPACVPSTVTSISTMLPTGTTAVSVPTAGMPAPTSTGVAPPGNDVPLQPIISIIVNATTQIQPLCDQLTSQQGSPDVDVVSGIIVSVTAIVDTCVAQLQATAQVDLTGLDLTNLCGVISALLNLIISLLDVLITIVVALGLNVAVTLQVVIAGLLNAVLGLTACLKVFITASLTGVLGPIFSLVCTSVQFLVSITASVNLVTAVTGTN